MTLTKTATKTDRKDAILFRDVLPVLQSDWIAVHAATGTIAREREGVATRDYIR